jgi:alpha-mannosidase
VEMSPLDAPLFTVGKMSDGTWPRELSFDRGHLFGYIMNNYWHTNYKASQGGAFTCRYSITSSSGGFSKQDATIAGWNMYCPAVAVAGQADQKPLLTSPAQSLVAVQPLGMPLTAIKQSEDGSGYILRLCDFAGEGGTATMTLPQSVQQLFNCNLVECNPHDLNQTGKTISVPVTKFAPVTLKAKFGQ